MCEKKVFLQENIEKMDIALKKLLLLDYLIYYDENSKPNDQTITQLSSGEIAIKLNTRTSESHFL